MELFETLRCYGYHGFGSGFEMASTGPPRSVDTGELYCSRGCPMKNDCWDVHRRRVRTLMPGLMAEMDRLAETVRGPELVKLWWDTYHGAPPDVAVMSGNMEDGACVASGGPPKDRGEFCSLTWPLTSLPPSVLDG